MKNFPQVIPGEFSEKLHEDCQKELLEGVQNKLQDGSQKKKNISEGNSWKISHRNFPKLDFLEKLPRVISEITSGLISEATPGGILGESTCG